MRRRSSSTGARSRACRGGRAADVDGVDRVGRREQRAIDLASAVTVREPIDELREDAQVEPERLDLAIDDRQLGPLQRVDRLPVRIRHEQRPLLEMERRRRVRRGFDEELDVLAAARGAGDQVIGVETVQPVHRLVAAPDQSLGRESRPPPGPQLDASDDLGAGPRVRDGARRRNHVVSHAGPQASPTANGSKVRADGLGRRDRLAVHVVGGDVERRGHRVDRGTDDGADDVLDARPVGHGTWSVAMRGSRQAHLGRHRDGRRSCGAGAGAPGVASFGARTCSSSGAASSASRSRRSARARVGRAARRARGAARVVRVGTRRRRPEPGCASRARPPLARGRETQPRPAPRARRAVGRRSAHDRSPRCSARRRSGAGSRRPVAALRVARAPRRHDRDGHRLRGRCATCARAHRLRDGGRTGRRMQSPDSRR